MINDQLSQWHATRATAAIYLSDARQQVHHAVQLGAAVGISYLEPTQSDEHTNLGWDSGLRALISRDVASAQGALAVGIRIEDLTLLVTQNGVAVALLPLHAQTLAQAADWLRGELAHAGLDPDAFTTARHYTIPEHAVDTGAAFDTTNRMAFEELAQWFSNAALVLQVVAKQTPDASDVRLWPHHFDIATLVSLSVGRSTGAGLVGGDGYYDQPYFYVNVNPQPTGPLPDVSTLGGGTWHTREWIGAVLPGSDITGDAAAQQDCVEAYLRASLATCRALANA